MENVQEDVDTMSEQITFLRTTNDELEDENNRLEERLMFFEEDGEVGRGMINDGEEEEEVEEDTPTTPSEESFLPPDITPKKMSSDGDTTRRRFGTPINISNSNNDKNIIKIVDKQSTQKAKNTNARVGRTYVG